MKRITLINLIIVVILVSSIINAQSLKKQQKLPQLTGDYLGQKPPGNTPELFAPGVISTESEEFGISFSPDTKEFYFSRRNVKSQKFEILYCRLNENLWTLPAKVSYFGDKSNAEPNFTPDGKIIFFGR
ncbi:MAG: PD40 domain-containing protein, partial [Calditrichia bacterium]|nr:PD40 domain-containing protein [Calditrichia bacterium]